MGYLCADVSCGERKLGSVADAQVGEAEPGLPDTESGERSMDERIILTERDDFPLEQYQDDTIKCAFEQVQSIDV